MTEATLTELADGLQFPEGPVVLPDGDLLVCELRTGNLVRVPASGGGEKTVVASVGGSANGAAIGPDGALYVCNSGGWRWTEMGPMLIPGDHGGTQADDYTGGRVQRVDLATGEVTELYREVDGHPLRAPNDLVFDASGGFWFTDHGHLRRRERDRGGVYYAQPDGSSIREAIYPVDAPNGVGLSPDGSVVYWAETHSGRLQALDLAGPGQRADGAAPRLIAGLPGMQLFDSLALQADGAVCVATIINGGISVITPDGDVTHVPNPAEHFDPLVTNIAFGGDDRRTAFVTLSGTGKLIACDWPTAGLALAFTA